MAEKFQFQVIEDRKFLGISSNSVKDLLIKWGMYDQMKVQAFTYDKHFQEYQKNEFVMVLSSSDSWVHLGILKAAKVEVDPVPCTIVNMDFFQKLFRQGLVRESGMIFKCFDEYVEGFTVSDELRKMHLMDDSDHFDVFSQDEKMEFIFRIFKHLCFGGDVCQFEDNVNPYLDTSKAIYKDLVSVYKDANTKELKTRSRVFKISALDSDGEMIYPAGNKHEQSFAYLVLDPLKRNLFVWYHQWRGIAW
ncbi:cilia- and flagella-associated protein 300-like isoform X2 [Dendronephthya gigantea]|uniref:cilia- and flagella-associated protein 300-like isoform X2 n=1 Tax=Dendronephthya gigantea TaxID=151771 RepID=UPI001069FB30|nr:cilia- and flagella-associated protein 300-like isoform X2 [Dendronephthya gigantea]